MSLACPCECNSGGFCGGCGHAGCSGGINLPRPRPPATQPFCTEHGVAYTDWCSRCVEEALAKLPAPARRAVFAVIAAEEAR